MGKRLLAVSDSTPPPLTARRAAWLVVRRADQRTAVESQQLTQLRAQPGELADAITLTADVVQLIRQRQGVQLDPWLERAAQSTLGVFRRFAQGLRDDDAAVKAGMTLPWSTGPVEGPYESPQDAETPDVWTGAARSPQPPLPARPTPCTAAHAPPAGTGGDTARCGLGTCSTTAVTRDRSDVTAPDCGLGVEKPLAKRERWTTSSAAEGSMPCGTIVTNSGQEPESKYILT